MSTIPGVTQPLIKPYPAGANSARTAGITVSNANAAQQTSLINTAHGGYRKKTRKLRNRKGGASSSITVPTFQVLYPETGAGTQTVNGNVTGTTQLGATSATSSTYDSCIGQGSACTTNMQNAGARGSTKRGGVKWGCYSGGKRNKNRKSKKKKITKRRKSRKYQYK